MIHNMQEILKASAFHIAAQAVHAESRGWEVREVSAGTPERPNLLDVCTTRMPRAALRVPEHAMVGALVGKRAAWWSYRGEPMPEKSFEEFVLVTEEEMEEGIEGVESDDVNVLAYLRRLAAIEFEAGPNPWADIPATYRVFCSEAERFVVVHWAEIEAVAEPLAERGHLGGAEVVQLIENINGRG